VILGSDVDGAPFRLQLGVSQRNIQWLAETNQNRPLGTTIIRGGGEYQNQVAKWAT
jgi:hypothetical protein